MICRSLNSRSNLAMLPIRAVNKGLFEQFGYGWIPAFRRKKASSRYPAR